MRTLQRIAEILETTPDHLLGNGEAETGGQSPESGKKADSVNWGAILAGTAFTATAVIAIVALAKATGKLSDRDKEQIEDILNRE